MARMGMDPDLVEQVGRQLKTHAASLSTLASQIDKVVSGLATTWEGPDARTFVTQWWPEHKKALLSVQSSVEGLGQSALNNASEQRGVSAAPGAVAIADSGGGAHGGGVAQAAVGGTAATNQAAVDKFASKWNGRGIDFDGRHDRQCMDVFRQYNVEVAGKDVRGGFSPVETWNSYASNGAASVYDKIPAGQGGPQPGDVIVYGSSDVAKYGNYGHIAVVTEVGPNGHYKVLEQNYTWDGIDGNDNAAIRSHTLGEKNTGTHVLGYLRPRAAKI